MFLSKRKFDTLFLIPGDISDVVLMFRDETVVDLSPDRYDFAVPKADIFVPGTDKLITKRYFEIYCQVFDYLQKYKADDTDAFIALMRVTLFFQVSNQFSYCILMNFCFVI